MGGAGASEPPRRRCLEEGAAGSEPASEGAGPTTGDEMGLISPLQVSDARPPPDRPTATITATWPPLLGPSASLRAASGSTKRAARRRFATSPAGLAMAEQMLKELQRLSRQEQVPPARFPADPES